MFRTDVLRLNARLNILEFRFTSDFFFEEICMDKGCDFPDIRELVKEYGYTAHIKSRGEENIRKETPGFRARR